MTSKRIKKKKTSFVALLLKLFKNREKEVSKNKHYPKHTSSSKGVTYKKERERNKTRGGDDLSFQSFLCEKKIPTLSHEEKHKKQQTSEKEKKRDKTNRRLLLLLRKTETLYTHFGGFIHSQEEKRALVVFFFVWEEIRCFFQEEILETINKHRVVSFEPLRDSNTNKRIKEERRGDSIVRIQGRHRKNWD